MKPAPLGADSDEPPQPTSATMSNEPTTETRRNITLKGTSGLLGRRNATLRRSLPVAILVTTALLAACGDTDGQPAAVPATTAVLQATTTVAVATSTTVPAEPATTTTLSDINVTESTIVGSTSTSATSRSTLPPTTVVMTTVAPVTTIRTTAGTPRLSLSQSTGLPAQGTRITVRGTGFDVSKGVYVIVCNQAAWTDARRCVGGVNIDGSSPVSEWISSNPPAYAKGLTVPFAADGSFTITLLVRANGDAIDCSKEPCGVVSFADHTRRDDRSQDVFVPISFAGGS